MTSIDSHGPKHSAEEIESPEKSQEQDVKKKKLGESCVCTICEDLIIDSSESEDNEGPVIIYCQGSCEACLRHQCAGCLSLSTIFLKLDKPYRCRLETYESLVRSMENKIFALEQKILALNIHASPSASSAVTSGHSLSPTSVEPSRSDDQISKIVTYII